VVFLLPTQTLFLQSNFYTILITHHIFCTRDSAGFLSTLCTIQIYLLTYLITFPDGIILSTSISVDVLVERLTNEIFYK